MKKQNGKKKLQEFDRQFKKKMGGGNCFRRKWKRFRIARRIGDFGQFRKLWGSGRSFRTSGGDADEKVLGNAEVGGGNDVSMGDLVEVVADDLLGINEAHGKEEQVQMVKFIGEAESSQE